LNQNDTIIALATSFGMGAIAVIRLSGEDAIRITDDMFRSKFGQKRLQNENSHTIHLGYLIDGERVIDEVLVSIFKGPNSYTGENTVEISCHGSTFIQKEIVDTFIKHGARPAEAGEFTLRAFLNGKLDLSQTEAVADLIHSQSELSKNIALNQLRGGFSDDLQEIKKQLIEFASLIELELDFSEEDVEFADRSQLETLVKNTLEKIEKLSHSFKIGNAIKQGIATTIVGRPNAGKSTLLNALLNEDRAIVTEIAGTTRDTLEETMHINGVLFRFIDTAGLRETTDTVEKIGVERAKEKMLQSQLIIYLFDASQTEIDSLQSELELLPKGVPHLLVANKIDLISDNQKKSIESFSEEVLQISALKKDSIDQLKQELFEKLELHRLDSSETIITNARHYDGLQRVKSDLDSVLQGLNNGLSGDLLAVDMRQALYHLGSITGEITSDDILGNIFANFCIGK
jgi:tRNA modification GTPase